MDNECKGLIFKGIINEFITTNKKETKIVLSSGIKLLKRKSCSGCIQCGIFYELLSDGTFFDHLIITNPIEKDRLYTLKLTNLSTDYETGITDDFDVELIEVEM